MYCLFHFFIENKVFKIIIQKNTKIFLKYFVTVSVQIKTYLYHFLLYQFVLINDQLNAFFTSICVCYVRVNFHRVKGCIALFQCIKVCYLRKTVEAIS